MSERKRPRDESGDLNEVPASFVTVSNADAQALLNLWKCSTTEGFKNLPFDSQDYFRKMFPTAFDELRKLDPSITVTKVLQRQPDLFPSAIDPADMQSKQDLYFVKNTGGHWCISRNKKRMVRPQEYLSLWNTLQGLVTAPPVIDDGNGLLILGHPGIGKSMLLDLLLSWSLHALSAVPPAKHHAIAIVVIAVEGTYVLVNGGRYKCGRSVDPLDLLTDLLSLIPAGSQILVLHDIKTADTLCYRSGLICNLKCTFLTTVVVASSPKESNYKDFCKDVLRRKRYVLPTLSWSETKSYLTSVVPSMLHSDQVEVYETVGGVPRFFIEKDARDEQVERMKQGIPSLKFDPAVNPDPKEQLATTNAVVMGVPNHDRTAYAFFDFVCSEARVMWLNRADDSEISRMWLRLANVQDLVARDVYGRCFENWILTKLAKEKSLHLCYQRLRRTAPYVGPLEKWKYPTTLPTVVNFSGEKFEDMDIVVSLTQPALQLPRSPQFPIVDAVLVSGTAATLIQVTVAKEHHPTYEQMKNVFGKLKIAGVTAATLVWVVDSASTLSWQTLQQVPAGLAANDSVAEAYNALPQYLCRMGQRMCWVKEQGHSKADAACFPIEATVDITNIATITALIQKYMQLTTPPSLPQAPSSTSGTFDHPIGYAK